jgi:uncharacterized protein (TIGR02246 family)
MIKSRQLAVLWVSVAVLAACAKTGPAAQDTTADGAAIRAVQNSWYKAYNAGDGSALAALYAEDAVLSAPGAPASRGVAAIREYFAKDAAKFNASGLTSVEAPTSDVGVSGDLAWQGDAYTVTDKSGATVDAGKTLTVFQRRAGKWMIIRDTWNSDTATAAPAATSAPADPPK